MLTLGGQPGFTDLADSTFDAGNPLSDTTMKALNSDAKFATVRNEQFWGYYRNGETVTLPVSPADGYTYSRAELLYAWSIYYSGPALAALLGTQTPPSGGATSGAGTILGFGAQIDQGTGVINTRVSYYKTAQTDTTDGILLVITHAQRNR